MPLIEEYSQQPLVAKKSTTGLALTQPAMRHDLLNIGSGTTGKSMDIDGQVKTKGLDQ
jgi:hypothetical protein